MLHGNGSDPQASRDGEKHGDVNRRDQTHSTQSAQWARLRSNSSHDDLRMHPE